MNQMSQIDLSFYSYSDHKKIDSLSFKSKY